MQSPIFNPSKLDARSAEIDQLQAQHEAITKTLAEAGVPELLAAMDEYGVVGRDAHLNHASETLKKLSDKGVTKSLAASFAAVEVALVEAGQAGQAGAPVDEIFSAIEPESVKLISHLLKNSGGEDASYMVFNRVKTLMAQEPKKFFVDAILEAVQDREYAVAKNGPTTDVLYTRDGNVSFDPGNLSEEGSKFQA